MIVVLLLGAVCVAPTYSIRTRLTTCNSPASTVDFCTSWTNTACKVGDTHDAGQAFATTVTSSSCIVNMKPSCGESSEYGCMTGSSYQSTSNACKTATGSETTTVVCTESGAFATSPFLSVFVVLVSLVLVA